MRGLGRLVRRVAAGEELVITRAGVPVARMVPIERPARRTLGVDRGRFEIPEDFDAPLPEEVVYAEAKREIAEKSSR
ncbi:MAG: type II toxin-antitoxin system prevent-host-death family antitoxin [Acidobacteriota bacterium]